MNADDLARVLNSLTRHSLEWDNHGYMSSQHMKEDKGGDWVSCEVLAEALGLEWDWVSGEFTPKTL